MWGLIAMMMVGVVGITLMENDDTDQNDADLMDDPEDEPGFIDDEEGGLLGTDLDDTLTLDEIDDPRALSRIDAGDGDDTLALWDGESEALDGYLTNLEIDTGAGDDEVLVRGEYISVDLGDGDDALRADLGESTIQAGAGNDHIDISRTGEGHVINVDVDGGDGDDVIDGRNLSDGTLMGGAGNDLIMTGGNGETLDGTGFRVYAIGGEGDDTIQYKVTTNLGYIGQEGGSGAWGGEGADRFELTVNEGEEPPNPAPYPISQEPDSLKLNSMAKVINGTTIHVETIAIRDFEPGIDTLSLDTTPYNEGFDLTMLQLDENAAGTHTDLILTYEKPGELARNVIVQLGTGGMTWDDIELENIDPDSIDYVMTGGDDVIDDSTPGAEDLPDTLYLYDGDDVVINETRADWHPERIEGGEGDDRIHTLAAGADIYGGLGNDHLSATGSTNLYGGAGDDQLTMDLATYLNDSVTVVDGGHGDDTLTVIAKLLTETPSDYSSAGLTGGEGADTFHVQLQAPDADTVQGDTWGVGIRDFDPTEDTLAVEYKDGDRSLIQRTEVTETQDGFTIVDLIGHDEDDNEIVLTTLSLGAVTGVTPDNIVIVT